ncbi:MAG: sigma-70 family RNA polymerase sigma factor [Candidatus Aminicenantes bacterium]|nr:sigma-70 family RNA polymerase sigma factor [Candidatus Aminicenantes bacterium]
MDEKELVKKAHQGHEDAFAALVEQYRRKMFNLAYSFTRNHEAADDLAQEVFLKAYLSLPKFQFKSSFGTWLYRIAVNTSKDYLRKEGKVQKVPFEESPADMMLHEDEMAKREEAEIQEDRKALLRRALQTLPEKYKVILTLRDIQGFPYGEIVEILNISAGTVDSRLHRARKLLRTKVHLLTAQLGGTHAV